MAITLGSVLVKSAKPEERQEGIRLLEGVAHGRGNAIGILADAVRAEDPVRARKLFEEAIKLWPGYSGYLADMLLKGEGGPKNERRAVSLVGGGWWGRASDAPSVRAMYGRLLVEGRLVTRDVKKGIELIFQGSNDYDTRLELIRALVANPHVPLDYPDGFLYDATVAAELGEPGAIAALIDLKLSRHVQFADKPGGCALLEQAAKSGGSASLPAALPSAQSSPCGTRSRGTCHRESAPSGGYSCMVVRYGTDTAQGLVGSGKIAMVPPAFPLSPETAET